MIDARAAGPDPVIDTIRTILKALASSAGLVLVLVLSAPAHAASPCAEAVIDDWADNASVDDVYEVACYREAIQALPDDLRNYSSAADDIRRALQEELGIPAGGSSGGDSSSGGSGSSSGGSGGSDSREPSGDNGAANDPPANEGSGREDGGEGDDGDEAVGSGSGDSGGIAAPDQAAFDRTLDDGSGSLPVPLIVVLAVAGVAALTGAAWLVRRQLRLRRLGG